MNWILIGYLAGSLVTSTHETREACEGRAVILKEKSVSAKCVESPLPAITYSYGAGISVCTTGVCR